MRNVKGAGAGKGIGPAACPLPVIKGPLGDTLFFFIERERIRTGHRDNQLSPVIRNEYDHVTGEDLAYMTDRNGTQLFDAAFMDKFPAEAVHGGGPLLPLTCRICLFAYSKR